MSQFPSTNPPNPTNTFTTQPPPSHHIHHPSDVLPGARSGSGSGADAPNYAADVTNDPRVWQDRPSRSTADTGAVMAGGQHTASPRALSDRSSRVEGGVGAVGGEQGQHTAFTEDRPMDVRPTAVGGVAVGGDADLPEGHAGLADKVIGKTQKVTGKMTHNAAMHEKGELREAGGKKAAMGQARAPHD